MRRSTGRRAYHARRRSASNPHLGSEHDRRTARDSSRHAIRIGALAVARRGNACACAAAHVGAANAIRQACRADFQANCAGVPAGGQAALACLQQNAAKASPACQQALRAVSDAAAAAPRAAAAPAPQPAAAARARDAGARPAADTWPHTVTGANGTATIYQPQVIAWPEHRTLTARVAIGVTPNGAKTPMFGVVEVAFDTQTELAERSVVLTAPRLAVREVSVGRRRAGRAVRSADPRGARGDGREARAAREHRAEPRAAGDDARRSPARQHAAANLRQHAPGKPRRVRRRTGGGADRRHVAVRRRQHELGRLRRQRDAHLVPAHRRRLDGGARRQGAVDAGRRAAARLCRAAQRTRTSRT